MPAKTHFTIEYTCGHTEDRDLSAKPAGDRAGFARWLGTHQTCSRCFRAANPRDTATDRTAEVTEAAERDGLPTDLVGTPKQVSWALTVRHDLLRAAYTALVEAGELDDADFTVQILDPAAMLDRAGWWIDNRDQDPATLPDLLADPGTLTAGATTENAA